jgi:hypothetical protein
VGSFGDRRHGRVLLVRKRFEVPLNPSCTAPPAPTPRPPAGQTTVNSGAERASPAIDYAPTTSGRRPAESTRRDRMDTRHWVVAGSAPDLPFLGHLGSRLFENMT